MKLKLLFFICMLIQVFNVSAKSSKNDSTRNVTKLNDSNVTAAIMDSEHLDDDSKVWVLAQARLETGWYTSKNARVNNNLFGLYDSKNRRYFKFDCWQDSIKAYAELVQNRRRDNESYPQFLSRIRYARHPKYVSALKKIIKRHGDKPVKSK